MSSVDDRIFFSTPLTGVAFFPTPGLNPGRLVIVTAPAVEPVSVDEMREFVRIDAKTEARTLNMVLKSARSYFERITGLALLQQTLRLELDRAPLAAGVEIPRAPLLAVGDDELVVNEITYLDADGAEQTLDAANYVQPRAGIPRSFARLRRTLNGDWPDIADLPAAFRVEFNAGFGTKAADVPEDLRMAVLMLAAHWYENRLPLSADGLAEIPMHLQSLIEMHRVAYIG